MTRWFLLGCVMVAAFGTLACGDGSGAFASSGGTYCEVTCGCSGTLGAPASAVRQCVDACSQSTLVDYDNCPDDVDAFGDCLYGTGNCDTGACTEELNRLTDCAFGE